MKQFIALALLIAILAISCAPKYGCETTKGMSGYYPYHHQNYRK